MEKSAAVLVFPPQDRSSRILFPGLFLPLLEDILLSSSSTSSSSSSSSTSSSSSSSSTSSSSSSSAAAAASEDYLYHSTVRLPSSASDEDHEDLLRHPNLESLSSSTANSTSIFYNNDDNASDDHNINNHNLHQNSSVATQSSSLTSSSGKVSWSDRGWGRREDFLKEVEAGLAEGSSCSSGITIARNLTLQEANELAIRVQQEAPQLKPRVASFSPMLYSNPPPPPIRKASTLTCSASASVVQKETEECDDEISIPLEFASICEDNDIRHNIVLYAPDKYLGEHHEWGNEESSQFIDQWYNQDVENTLCSIMTGRDLRRNTQSRQYTTTSMGRSSSTSSTMRQTNSVEQDEDVDYGGISGNYTWTDRGWMSRDVFVSHTRASLKRFGCCALLRRSTLRDAKEVYRALTAAGFDSSLFVTPSLEAEKGEDDRPVLMCPNQHPTVAVDNGYQGICSTCGGESRPEDLMLRCSQCNYNLCSACATERTRLLCPVLAGRYRGDTIPYPSTSALPMVQQADDIDAEERETVNAISYFSAQVAGDNTSAVSSGADDEASMMNRLDQVLGRLGIEKNAKPKAKDSAVAALPRELVGEGENTALLKSEACIICMNEFVEGDKALKMPCGHWFHEGSIDAGKDMNDSDRKEANGADGDEDESCDGILPWLQTSNRCPMCREEIEADTGAAISKLVPALSGSWRCPGCQCDLTSFSCSHCDVRRNVHIAATHTAKALFDMVEALFIDLWSHHERKRRGQAAAVQELELYHIRIDCIVSSHEAQHVVSNNWMLQDAIKNLLQLSFEGKRKISFASPFMDANSKALYVLLVERLEKKLVELSVEDISFERPSFDRSTENEGEWTCPLCGDPIPSGSKSCSSCGCERKVCIIAESDDPLQNVRGVLADCEGLTFRTLSLQLDRSSASPPPASAWEQLEADVERCLASVHMRRLELAGWKIRCHMEDLFHHLLKSDAEGSFPFRYYSDINSAGLFAVFVRRVRRRLAGHSNLSDRRGCGQSVFEEPHRCSSVTVEEDFEPLQQQRYYVHGQTFGLLQSERRFLMKVAHLIAEQASEPYWRGVLKRFSLYGDAWDIAKSIEMMREGERGLEVLAGGLQCFGQALIEALLRKVVALEALHQSDTGDLIEATGDTTKNLSNNMKEEDNCAIDTPLRALKESMPPDELKQCLKFLLKTLKALAEKPDSLSSRRMRKTTPAVSKLVVVYPLVLDIVTTLGFVDEGSHFQLYKLDEALVRESLEAVEKFELEMNA